MIQNVLDELKASAIATLPGKIDAIATKYGVELDRGFSTYDWWQTEAQALKLAFPALSVTWSRASKTGLRDAHAGRTSRHTVTLSYGVRSLDMAYIQRHITRIPEAMLLWLDEFPVTSRSSGATIIGLVSDKGDEIEVSHDLVSKDGGVLIWGVDITLPLRAYDAQLPPRST